jgi:FKBP-type peptidyl-prolyl cis-trans isomerase
MVSRLFILIGCLGIFLFGCKEKKQQRKRVTKEMLLEMNRSMVSTEAEVIEKFIADKKLQMKKSATGYYYKVDTLTSEALINTNDLVTLAYTTRLLDGTICYSSATEGLMTFTVGKAQVEAGLEQFITALNKGAIAKLILPPYLAHGIAGDGGQIPKLAIIQMDIEVVDVQQSQAE